MRILVYEGTPAELSEYFKAQLADECDECEAPLGEEVIANTVRAVLEQLSKQK